MWTLLTRLVVIAAIFSMLGNAACMMECDATRVFGTSSTATTSTPHASVPGNCRDHCSQHHSNSRKQSGTPLLCTHQVAMSDSSFQKQLVPQSQVFHPVTRPLMFLALLNPARNVRAVAAASSPPVLPRTTVLRI